MKEWLHSFDSEEYHNKIYRLTIDGEIVGQHDIFGNILFVSNPEKYPPLKQEPPVEKRPASNPLQGEFILPKPWNNEYNPIPYRGATPRGRRT